MIVNADTVWEEIVGPPLRLNIELTPEPLWGIAIEDIVGTERWERIACNERGKSDGFCMRCDRKTMLECDPVWKLDEESRLATLVGFEVVCEKCLLLTSSPH
jgi:hypothetical protein